jgi:hypothetical protein
MESFTSNQWSGSLTDGTPLQDLVADAKAPTASQASNNKLPMMHVGSGYKFGNLTWFPVWTDEPIKQRNYSTAKSQEFLVSEAANAVVQSLKVDNQADLDLLLLEGSILEGGWQHRALIKSVIVPGRASCEIPVVCVEQNRWGGSAEQSTGTKVAPVAVRVAMKGIVRDNQGNVAQSAPDQSRVWSSVASYQTRHGAQAPTASLVDIENQVKRNIAAMAKIEPLPGQRGVVVAILGQPIAFELFDHPDTLEERLQGMLESYLLDAADRPYKKTSGQAARDFVLLVSKLKLDAEPQERRTVRLHSRNSRYVVAEALQHQGALVHVSCINSQHELVLAA